MEDQRLQELLRHGRYIVRELVRRFFASGQMKNAAALTYTTLFAVVPLMTVAYTALSMFPQAQEFSGVVERFVFEKFVPSSGAQLLAQLQAFSDQARSLTFLGVAFLFVTAYLLLVNVEEVFNQIWGVAEQRRGVARFALYWSVLTFGPPALGAAIAVSSLVLSVPLLNHLGGLPLRAGVLSILPWVISGTAFTFVFYAVPNCPVRLVHALAGGLLTMIALHSALALFAFVMRESSFEVIYGTFAAVPLFLSWMYLCWSLVLLGALFVKLLSEPLPGREAVRVPALVAALTLLRELAARHEQGLGLDHAAVLRIVAAAGDGTALLKQLQAKALVVRSDRGEWLLGRNLQRVSLWDLNELVGGTPAWSADGMDMSRPTAVRLAAATEAARTQLEVSLAEIVGQDAGNPP